MQFCVLKLGMQVCVLKLSYMHPCLLVYESIYIYSKSNVFCISHFIAGGGCILLLEHEASLIPLSRDFHRKLDYFNATYNELNYEINLN